MEDSGIDSDEKVFGVKVEHSFVKNCLTPKINVVLLH